MLDGCKSIYKNTHYVAELIWVVVKGHIDHIVL